MERRGGPERSEEELVRGVAAGDDVVVREFLTRTHHPVWCMAARLRVGPELRQDWTHDVLLGVISDLERGRFEYRGPGSFWGWFRKRAYFRLLDQYRKTRLHWQRESPAGEPGELPEPRAWTGGEDPQEELHRTELRAGVEACLEKLPNENQRRALEALLWEEAPYEAIATRLEAPLNTVRAWIRRGRLALRKCLVATLGLQPPADLDPSSEQPDGGRA